MSEQLKLLTLGTLAELDDSLPGEFEALLTAAAKDCLSRPSIKKKRTVSIVLELTPILRTDGTVDDIEINTQLVSKGPARIIPTMVARATVNGGLKFNKESPDCPDQKTIFGDDKE